MADIRISPEQVKRLMDMGGPLVIVDARSPADFMMADRQIPGSLRVAPKDVDDRIGEFARGATYVVYCADPDQASSLLVANRLTELGFKAFAIDGGFDRWMDDSFTTEPKGLPGTGEPVAL